MLFRNAGPVAPDWNSRRFDGGFWLQQDRNPVANGVYSPAFFALEGFLPAQDQRLTAHRAGKYLQ